jgi:hypothetical protein
MKWAVLFSIVALPVLAQPSWNTMIHGSAFINDVQQTGPRGGDKLFSTNWIMGTADRPLAGGHLLLRAMLSLEPATITHRAYPELFQTGETAYGRPLADAQHPHDFLMELAVQYSRGPLSIYVAPMGSPALGPIGFPHRESAAEIPQAPLGHHWEDSTHIAADVITGGARTGAFLFEVSAFHGGEPDENRWNIEHGAIDSWSVRGTYTASPKWSGQISGGHLRRPEALEPGDVKRLTASVSYQGGGIAASFIAGRNDKSDGPTTNAFTGEASWNFLAKNYLEGRTEAVEKDEIIPGQIVRVKALTVGYTRDVFATRALTGGVGGNVTLYDVPSNAQALYGSGPRAYYLFVRIRGQVMSTSMPMPMGEHHHHEM